MAKPRKNTQAWAITYADMVTLLLTFFVLLLVILSEAEKQIDLEISKLLDKAQKQIESELNDKNIDVERVGKGVKITIRGKLFEQLSPNISPKYIPKIARIGELIKDTDLMQINTSVIPDSANPHFNLLNGLDKRDKELAIEIRCEGHTDDAPIPADKRVKYETNWQLSTDRSLNVVNLMNKYAAMPLKYFSALGYGEHRPLISVSSIKNKKTRREKDRLREYNRRVEIYLDAFARDKIKSNEEELIQMLGGKKRKKDKTDLEEAS